MGPWHALAHEHGVSLQEVVEPILSTATTRALPTEWYGDYDTQRTLDWIVARDAESPTLLVIDRPTGAAIGLIILFEDRAGGHAAVDLRLGYLLAESTWGAGYGTELVEGFVAWALDVDEIHTVSGGVATDNPASARVLLKNGFALVGESANGEHLYQLDVGGPSGR